MKRIVLAAAAAISITGAAGAADFKAPVYKAPVAIPAYNWTGFYLGVNAGFGVGESPSTLNVPALLWANTFNLSPIGAIGGAQVGYNWQFGNWVLGVEADIQASGMKDSDNCLLRCIVGAQSATFEQSLDWFGTARGRIGYATGPILAYYTGGFAFGRVKTTIAETFGGVPGAFAFTDDSVSGWTLGSGVEAALGGNWTAKLEYLYLDLGEGGLSYTHAGIAHSATSEFRSHIFRGGLNYRIGGTQMASAYPAYNWTGFYIGANAGSGLARNESSFVINPPLFNNERFVLAPRGFIGGAQIGFNWQAGNFVYGLEADFQGSTQKDDDTCISTCQPAALPGVFSSYDQSLPWFGTLRGRIGYSAGPALFYLTGGLAYGKVETTVTEQIIVAPPFTAAFDETKAGWTIGGGVEQPFNLFGLLPGNNWTLKTEYLYVDLGSVSNTFTLPAVPGVNHTFTTDVQNHIFRTGLNYRFGGGPVVAR